MKRILPLYMYMQSASRPTDVLARALSNEIRFISLCLALGSVFAARFFFVVLFLSPFLVGVVVWGLFGVVWWSFGGSGGRSALFFAP